MEQQLDMWGSKNNDTYHQIYLEAYENMISEDTILKFLSTVWIIQAQQWRLKDSNISYHF